jgi:hypothetical protein
MNPREQADAIRKIHRAAEYGETIDAALVIAAIQPMINAFAALLAPLSYLDGPIRALIEALNGLPIDDEDAADV